METQRRVLFSPPNLGEEEIAEAIDTLRSDWITTGPKTRLFEDEFREYVSAPAALALNSCTAGLHLSLLALDIGPGDEVATTPMTFAASVNVIEHVGAEPLLIDVEKDTLNMSPKALEASMNPRVKAILVVHYAGHPVDLDAISAIAEKHGVPIVEDAAHALPAWHNEEIIGSRGNLTAYSFYATKNITTCEGGMLTGPEELLDRARVLSLHGLSKDAAKRYEKGGSWRYDILHPGFKDNMTDLQAAIGRVQLRRLEGFQARRREVIEAYNSAFEPYPGIRTPIERSNCISALHLYPIRVSARRDETIEFLNSRGIGTSVHFIPIHLHPYYRDKYGYAPEDLPVAYRAFQGLISLPLHSGLRDEDVAAVIEAVRASQAIGSAG